MGAAACAQLVYHACTGLAGALVLQRPYVAAALYRLPN